MGKNRIKAGRTYPQGRTYQPKHHYEKKVTAIPTFVLSSPHVSSATTASLMFTLLLLSSCAISAYAQCEPPKGSYKETCEITGTTYSSTDPNLKAVAMCKFEVDCKKVDGEKREHTTIYMPKSMKGCLTFFENCGGRPVIRDGDKRMCVNPEDAKREYESQYKAKF